MSFSNFNGECSLSVLKRVKTYLRSSLANEKIKSLSLLCVESEVVKSIDWSTLIQRFDKDKERKKL
jgi:hypothetical protein